MPEPGEGERRRGKRLRQRVGGDGVGWMWEVGWRRLWCWFWRRAWAWLHRGVVDLKLVATIPTTRADGNLKIKMSLKKELLIEYLLRWVIIAVNVNAHSTSYWGLWQVPLGMGVL